MQTSGWTGLTILIFCLSAEAACGSAYTAWQRVMVDAGEARSIAVDGDGNVLVFVQYSDSGATTTKYTSNGDSLWTRAISGNVFVSPVRGQFLVVDADNAVYVAATADYGVAPQFLLVKYAADGTQLWQKGIDASDSGDNSVRGIAIGPDGNVYLTGRAQNGSLTIKYSPDGDTIWTHAISGIVPAGIAVFDDQYFYLTAYSPTMLLAKYSSTGDTVWMRNLAGAGPITSSSPIAFDGTGSIYVVGYTTGLETYQDIEVAKFNPDGDTAWTRKYNGSLPGWNNDYPTGLQVDNAGNVTVAGTTYVYSSTYSFVTLKYGSNGDLLWSRNLQTGNASGMAVDAAGNSYVAGSCAGAGWCVTAYSGEGDSLWTMPLSGVPAGIYSFATAIAVNAAGGIFVTGSAALTGVPAATSVVTARYSACDCLCHADPNCDGAPEVVDVVSTINVAFRGGQPFVDQDCPLERTDVDCNTATDVLDVVEVVNVAFRGAEVSAEFCSPCSP